MQFRKSVPHGLARRGLMYPDTNPLASRRKGRVFDKREKEITGQVDKQERPEKLQQNSALP
jgi:hypothetical protein